MKVYSTGGFILIYLTNCFLGVSALTPDQLIELLREQTEVHEPPPSKESQAAVLGQLLRKFLENSFRRIHYELFILNSTLGEITESQGELNVHQMKLNEQQEEFIKVQEELRNKSLSEYEELRNKSRSQYEELRDKTHSQFEELKGSMKQLQGSVDMIKIVTPQIGEIKKAVAEFTTLKNITADIKHLREEILSDSKRHIEGLVRLIRMSYSNAIRLAEMHEVAVQNRSCYDLLRQGERESGIFPIMPQHADDKPVHVYCDMGTDGGGWTVIQIRGVGNFSRDERPNFNRNWIEYEAGFGNASSDYWLGLENIRALTRNCPHELLINLTDWDGQNRYAHYQKFFIASKLDLYRLHVSSYSGNVDDSLLYHNLKKFSTFDEDNDEKWGDINSSCAKLYGGGWWYGDCLKSNLNGVYPDDDIGGRVDKHKGLRWNAWTTMKYSLRKTEMKIRPLHGC